MEFCTREAFATDAFTTDAFTRTMLTPVGHRRAEPPGDQIAELSVHLDAASARLLDLIREFDARGGSDAGFRSCAEWLSWRVGLDLGAARQKVRVARAHRARLAAGGPQGRGPRRRPPPWTRTPRSQPGSGSA